MHSFVGQNQRGEGMSSLGCAKVPRRSLQTVTKKILTANDNAFQSVRRMESVIKLNPYEKGLVYGYPYVVGRVDGISIRGPLFHVPVKVTVTKSSASIEVEEDTLAS